jgi:hypothetical protein
VVCSQNSANKNVALPAAWREVWPEQRKVTPTFVHFELYPANRVGWASSAILWLSFSAKHTRNYPCRLAAGSCPTIRLTGKNVPRQAGRRITVLLYRLLTCPTLAARVASQRTTVLLCRGCICDQPARPCPCRRITVLLCKAAFSLDRRLTHSRGWADRLAKLFLVPTQNSG